MRTTIFSFTPIALMGGVLVAAVATATRKGTRPLAKLSAR